MDNVELLALAQRVRDAVWKGRTIDEIPDGDELLLATDTRELWQQLTNRVMDDPTISKTFAQEYTVWVAYDDDTVLVHDAKDDTLFVSFSLAEMQAESTGWIPEERETCTMLLFAREGHEGMGVRFEKIEEKPGG